MRNYSASKMPNDLFEQGRIKSKIKNLYFDAPFEINLATEEEYEGLYKNFLKEDILEL